MASQETMQYYDGKLISDEGNLVYQNLINCVPVKPPYFNSSFRTIFTQGGGEKGDKKQFFVNKRQGFTKLPIYECDHTTPSADIREFTDMIELDGFRYFFAISTDFSKMRVYKQINIADKSPCDHSCLNDIDEGNIVNMTSYKGNDYFPFNKCLYTRFLMTPHGKGKRKAVGTTGIARSRRVDDSTFSSLYDALGNQIAGDPGDYIYITNGLGITGYFAQIGGRLQDVDASNTSVPLNALMLSPPGTRLPGLNMTAPNGSIINDASINQVEYSVFPEYGLTFHFVTADGIIHRGRDDGICQTAEYTTATSTKNKDISSLKVYDDTVAYIDKNTGVLALGGQGYMKFNFSPSLRVMTSGLYTQIVEYMGYLVTVGPDNIGRFSYDRKTGASVAKSITTTNGYFTPYSFGAQDGNFFIIRKSKNFYQMGITTSAYTLPVRYFTYMNNFLNTDLGMLDRRIDECTLDLFDDKFWIILNDGSGDSKILIHDQYYQLRYKRYITGCSINRVIDNIFLGKGIFKYGGLTDNGNEITQIITMTRGDEGHTATKKVEYVKIPFGYNSYMQETNNLHQTGNCTFFSCSTIDSGRWYDVVYGQLSRTDYVDNLMKLKFSATQDNQTLGLIKHFPLGIDINGTLGVNHDKKISTLHDEFEQYHHFYDDYPNTDESDNPTVYYVSKMGVIKVPLAHRGEVFTFELIARGNNNVEFGGFFIGYQYPDIDINRYENNLTMNDEQLTPDSGYTWAPIVTNPDQVLGVTP